jgi:hypothetical protein
VKSQANKIETPVNQKSLGKETPIAIPIDTEARKTMSFPRRILLAVLALVTAFGMGMASNLSAAEPAATSPGSLLTKEYRASSELLASLRKASAANASAPLTEVFESLGVPFPEGAWAQVAPGGNLIVRNTKENMELVDTIIETNSKTTGVAR